MINLSPASRPLTLSEAARVLDVPVGRLERLVLRHRIAPACRIGRTRVYGPRQLRAIFGLTQPEPVRSA